MIGRVLLIGPDFASQATHNHPTLPIRQVVVGPSSWLDQPDRWQD
jgi:hypothetical protein